MSEKIVNKILGRIKKSDVSQGFNFNTLPPNILDAVRRKEHSLGDHPAFPRLENSSFDELILNQRFNDVTNHLKCSFDTEEITPEIISSIYDIVSEIQEMERHNLKELVEIAIEMVKEEFDIPENAVDIDAEITNKFNIDDLPFTPTSEPHQFESYDQSIEAIDEIKKRRLINALIQGSATKTNHMFHLANKKLMDVNPRLINAYDKFMTLAEYTQLMIPKPTDGAAAGGRVHVEFNDKPKIIARAISLPILIHEIIKGMMEIFSAHGLPKDKKMCEYVLGKADFAEAELWDMRLGTALWEKFCDAFDADDFHLKHHVFTDLVKKSPAEFNKDMREIFSGSIAGKTLIADMVGQIKSDMVEDEMNDNSDDDEDIEGFDISELGF